MLISRRSALYGAAALAACGPFARPALVRADGPAPPPFGLLAGYNSFSRRTIRSAVSPGDDQYQREALGSSAQYRVVTTKEDYQKELDISVSAGLSGAISLSASADYKSISSFSDTTVAVIISARTGYKLSYPNVWPEFAWDKLPADRFVQLYGDSYVSAIARGGVFVFSYLYALHSSEEQQNFAASLGGSYGVVSAESKVALSTSLKRSVEHRAGELIYYGTNQRIEQPNDIDYLIGFAQNFSTYEPQEGKEVTLSVFAQPYEGVVDPDTHDRARLPANWGAVSARRSKWVRQIALWEKQLDVLTRANRIYSSFRAKQPAQLAVRQVDGFTPRLSAELQAMKRARAAWADAPTTAPDVNITLAGVTNRAGYLIPNLRINSWQGAYVPNDGKTWNSGIDLNVGDDVSAWMASSYRLRGLTFHVTNVDYGTFNLEGIRGVTITYGDGIGADRLFTYGDSLQQYNPVGNVSKNDRTLDLRGQQIARLTIGHQLMLHAGGGDAGSAAVDNQVIFVQIVTSSGQQFMAGSRPPMDPQAGRYRLYDLTVNEWQPDGSYRALVGFEGATYGGDSNDAVLYNLTPVVADVALQFLPISI